MIPMSNRNTSHDFPRDPKVLVRDFDAAGRLKDIRDADELKDRLTPRWWEGVLWVLQFMAALGLLGSVMLYSELNKTDPGRIMVFFLALCVLSITLTAEFMLFKLHHLRRANAISVRMIEDLRKRVEQVEAAQTPAPSEPAGRGEQS
jgi:hypothetical protein